MTSEAAPSTVQTFHEFASVPGISGAWPVAGGFLVKRSQRDPEANKSRAFLQHFAVSETEGLTAASPFPLELRDVSVCAPSPSGRLLALVRSEGGKDATKRFVELWDGERLARKVDVSDAHGKILADDWFAGFEWSADESRIVYVAEPKAPKAKGFFAGLSAPANEDDSSEEKTNDNNGEEFRFREDWGEKYVGVCSPRLFLLTVADGSVRRLEGVPEALSAGQATWHPDGESVVFTGWPAPPRRLGIIYCYQRRCRVYRLTLDGAACAPLTPPEDAIARSPRFSPDGAQMAYLASGPIATHNSCFALKVLEVASGAARALVDVVQTPAGDDAFPGVHCGRLPACAWTADGAAVVFSSQWRSAVAAVRVDAASGAVQRLAGTAGAAAVLCASAQGVLVAESCPTAPARLALYRSPTTALYGPEPHAPAALAGMFWTVLSVEPRDGSGVAFEAFLLSAGSEASGKRPLVVVPHGGPHSCYPTSFSFAHAFMAARGFSVLAVNYRGSTGFGRAALESLPGKCGTQDITDMEDAVVAALARFPDHLDETRMAVCGGSHGGFIAAHLIGQQPALFKCAVLRNPVCNIASMVGHTDIPDWCWVEAGLPYDFDSYPVPSAEDLRVMLAASPIAHVDNVRVPTLFTIGAKDRRVPPLVGHDYFHVLRARGLDPQMLWYPEDCHAIDSPASEADAWVHIADFVGGVLSVSG